MAFCTFPAVGPSSFHIGSGILGRPGTLRHPARAADGLRADSRHARQEPCAVRQSRPRPNGATGKTHSKFGATASSSKTSRARQAQYSDVGPKRAKAYKTGARLYLGPCPSDAPATVRRYICCPSCSTAYVGNAVVALTDVRCPSCSHRFKAAPDTLLVEVDPVETAAVAEKEKQKSALEDAPPGTIVCKHFGECPGCMLQTEVRTPAVAREAEAFARNALRVSKPMSLEMGSAMGWRTHAKLAVRQEGMGLFKVRSHEIVEIPDCTVHHPAINAAAKALQKAMKDCGARAYHEDSGKGRVRYALFTVQRETGKVQVTVVWNATSWKDGNPGAPRLAAQLWNDNKDILHSVWFNWNVSMGNTITSQKDDAFYLMHGPALLREKVAGARVYYAPTVFRQANLDAFETMLLPRLLSYIPKQSAVVELHGGVGVISLAALRQQEALGLRSVTVTEISSFASAPFRKALTQFDASVSEIAQFVVGSDDESTEYAVYEDADVVIVDPPRAGVSEACLAELASPPSSSPLKRIIYVSCGFQAFQRDARALLAGQWTARAVHGYILFPGSNHIELLAIFDRKRAA